MEGQSIVCKGKFDISIGKTVTIEETTYKILHYSKSAGEELYLLSNGEQVFLRLIPQKAKVSIKGKIITYE